MSRRRALLLGPLSALLVLLPAVAMPRPAYAYTSRSHVTVERTAALCLQASATIDHRSSAPFSGNQGWAEVYGFAADCTTVLPSMKVRVRLQVQRWNESSGAWEACATVEDWVQGTTKTSEFGPVGVYVATDYTPCGPGWYQTKTEAQAYRYVDAAGRFLWFGGTLTSGSEWVD